MTITLTREEAQQVLDAVSLAMSSHDVMLASDPPQDAWKARGVQTRLAGAWATLCARLAQPERKWQGLTDEEMSEAMDYWSDPVRSAYGGAHSADGEYVGMVDTWRYIEAKLKERNT
jgi:hypothetical protein